MQIAAIKSVDMSRPEAILSAQAASLQSIYVRLSMQAFGQESLQWTHVLMAMPLKAQAQCRCTLEALNEIKFPKSATFVKQANVANQQQVNNGIPVHVEKNRPSNRTINRGKSCDIGPRRNGNDRGS